MHLAGVQLEIDTSPAADAPAGGSDDGLGGFGDEREPADGE